MINTGYAQLSLLENCYPRSGAFELPFFVLTGLRPHMNTRILPGYCFALSVRLRLELLEDNPSTPDPSKMRLMGRLPWKRGEPVVVVFCNRLFPRKEQSHEVRRRDWLDVRESLAPRDLTVAEVPAPQPGVRRADAE